MRRLADGVRESNGDFSAGVDGSEWVVAWFGGAHYRAVMLVVGVLFHLGIAVCFGLWSFSATMTAALLMYLVRPTPSSSRAEIARSADSSAPALALDLTPSR